jgi:periplasmic mercuric ion binding protein
MKNLKTVLPAVSAALALVAPAWASLQTATLNVPGMTCPVCPITVKKALEKVPGVSKVDVRFEKKQVLVTFDDAKTNTDALVKARMNGGFPSQHAKAAQARALPVCATT